MQTKVKVLIITYNFPPFIRAGALRTLGWFENFSDEIHVTVLTRKWEENRQYNNSNYYSEDSKEIVCEDNDLNKKIIRVPNRHNWYYRLKYSRFVNLIHFKKIMTFFELIFKWSSISQENEKSIYKEAIKLLNIEKFDWIIVSGEPFILFKYALNLKKKFGVRICLDYRDGFSTNDLRILKTSILERALILNDRYFEKKALRNADLVSLVSQKLKDDIVQKVYLLDDKKTIIINNGIDFFKKVNENYPKHKPNFFLDKSYFNIVFVGTIYKEHRIEIILNSIKKLVKNHNLRIRISFIGSLQNLNKENLILLNQFQKELAQHILLTGYLDNELVKLIQKESTILLKFNAFEQREGHFGKKLYEYAFSGRKVISINYDSKFNNRINFFDNKPFIYDCNDTHSVELLLENFYQSWEKGKVLDNEITYDELLPYSSSFQSLKLEKKLIQISEESNTGLKKILMISYFAPPANFVASERISSWMKDLPKFGIHPVLLTRHWTDEQTSMDTTDVLMRYQQITSPTSQTYKIAIKKTIIEKLGLTNFKYLRKTNSILVYLKLYLIPSLSYNKKFLKTAQKIIKDQNIDKVVISGTPFSSFWIGYKLKQWNSNIEWYPDYRDTWNSIQNKEKYGIVKEFFLRKMELNKEKKWTSNANMFFTVSEDWKNSISSLIGKKGLVIKNGFDKTLNEIIATKIPRKEKSLVITYAGTIYPSQDIFRLLDAVSELMTSERINIKVNFIG
ncbi:MAG: glycosyltransferase, partial [Bacteroidota bacterium]